METVPLTHYVPVNQDLNIRIDPQQRQQTTMDYVTRSEPREFAYVEISDQGRQLAQEDIVNHAARYFFSADINAALSTALSGVPQQVSEAAYRIIDDNFMNTGTLNDEQRQIALELGLSQADYLAENYLSSEQRATFLDNMQRIAAISLTRTADENGKVSYTTSPARIPGTEEYKIDWLSVMQKEAPEQYAAFQAEMAKGGNGLDLFLDFFRSTTDHPEWARDYQSNATEREKQLANTVIDNRFAEVDRTSTDTFIAGARAVLEQIATPDITQHYSQQLARFLSSLATVNA